MSAQPKLRSQSSKGDKKMEKDRKARKEDKDRTKTKEEKDRSKEKEKILTHSDIFNALENANVPLCHSRKNVLRDGKPYYGMQMGKIIAFGLPEAPIQESNASKANPELKKLLFKFGKQQFPGFRFTSISVNKSYRMAKHKDKNNVGTSRIIGVGDYSGGELVIWDEDGNNPVAHDIRKGVAFNGAELWHEVRPFKGKRWSLVYYYLSKNKNGPRSRE